MLKLEKAHRFSAKFNPCCVYHCTVIFAMAKLIWHSWWERLQGPLIISDLKKNWSVDEAQFTVMEKKKKRKKRENKSGAHLNSIKDFTTLSRSNAVKFGYLQALRDKFYLK